jgi:hypothetical protein
VSMATESPVVALTVTVGFGPADGEDGTSEDNSGIGEFSVLCGNDGVTVHSSTRVFHREETTR